MVEVPTRLELKNYTPLEPFKSRIQIYVGTGDTSVLDPRRNITKEYIEAFAPDIKRGIDNQTFTLIEKASKKERTKKAGFERKDIDEAVQTWAEKNSKLINRKKGDKALTRFFEVDPKDVTKEMMVEFYEKYFSGPNKESNIRKFIADVVERYKTGSGQRIDLASLKNDLTSVQNLAGAFGETSSEVITQLIDAEVELSTTADTDLSIKLCKEINNVGEDDNRLLQFLIEGERLDAPKPISPTPVPPTPEDDIPAWMKSAINETEIVIDENSTGTDVLKKLTEARKKYEINKRILDDYDGKNPSAKTDEKDELRNKLFLLAEKSRQLIGSYEKLIYGIEDKILPELLGTDFETIKKYILNTEYELGIRQAIIKYFSDDRADNQITSNLIMEIDNQLGSFNRLAQAKGIPNFKPTNIEDLVNQHERAITHKLVEIKNGTWKKEIAPEQPVEVPESGLPKPAAPKVPPIPSQVRSEATISAPPTEKFTPVNSYEDIVEAVKRSPPGDVLRFSTNSEGFKSFIPTIVKSLEKGAKIPFLSLKIHEDPGPKVIVSNKSALIDMIC